MSLVALDAIRDAAGRVSRIATRTPILDATGPAGRSLRLKCESHQPGGAFKIRGATNMMLRLDEADRAKGVITYSSGNHGQAVALAASRLGVPAVVVMPTTAPAVKVAGVKRWGAEVVFEGTTSLERKVRAEAVLAERGLTMIPPFDHPWIIEGQGTCGLEIVDEVQDVDLIVAPIGGGGLISGVSAAVRQAHPTARVIGVEPAGAAKMTASLAAGHPVTLDTAESLADGLIPVRPGDLTFAHTREFVDQVVTVSEAHIARAALWLFYEMKQVVEPSGAATTAAVLWPGDGSPLADQTLRVVAIVSGGNVSPDTLVALEELHGSR
jgi:threonine dehydratase